MRDQTIEQRLRATLRSEADQLPLTVTVDELERRLLLRRRAAAGRRAGLIAAGVAVVVVGGAIVLATNPFRGTQVATTPQPTIGPSTPPASTVPVTPVPSNLVLPSGPQGDPALQDLNGSADAVDTLRTTIPGDPSSTDTTASAMALDHVRQGAREVGIQLVCKGPDRLTLSWVVGQGVDDAPTSIADESIPCDNTIASFRYDISARQPLIDDLLLVSATPRISYRVLVETFGDMNVPPRVGVADFATPGGKALVVGSDVFGSSEATTTKLGTVPPRSFYRVAIVCNTTEATTSSEEPTATWSIGSMGSADFIDAGGTACDGVARGFSSAAGLASGARDVYVTADPHTVWRLVLTDPSGPPPFIPPSLTMWAGTKPIGDGTSGPAQCVGYDANVDQCGAVYSAHEGAALIFAPVGSSVTFQLGGGWRIASASMDAADRAVILSDPASAQGKRIWSADTAGDTLTAPIRGLEPGDYIVRVSIQGVKGSHRFEAYYEMPLRVE